jgi:hypothetical protein
VFGGVLGVVIGLAFVYLVLSLVCSGITELINNILNLRAKNLEKALGRLLSDEAALRLYESRLIRALSSSDRKKPSYIPPRTFSLAVLSTFVPDALDAAAQPRTPDTRARITQAIEQVPIEQIRESLRTLWVSTEHDIDRFRSSIEHWFDDTMQRASGWYTRKAKFVLLLVGLAVAVGVNVDSFVVGTALWRDPTVRAAAVDAATAAVSQSTATTVAGGATTTTTPAGGSETTATTTVASGSAAPCPTSVNPSTAPSAGEAAASVSCLDQLSLPIGWTFARGDVRRVPGGFPFVGRLLGWLITGAALSLGASFWFTALSNLVGLRTSSKPPPPTTGGSASIGLSAVVDDDSGGT